jgi:hypothetical protein
MEAPVTLPVEPEPLSAVQIGEADGESYSLIAAEDVTLEDGTVVSAGDALHIDEVIAALEDDATAITSVWVVEPEADEPLAEGCMKKCSKLCPPHQHAECWAEERGGRDCCKCQCIGGAGAIYCTCEAWEPQ